MTSAEAGASPDGSATRHDAAGSRFVARVDGHEAEVRYQLDGEVMAITHTLVPPEIGGRGVAGDLVRVALDFARAQNLRVLPQCSYAAAFLQRHKEYADLLA